MCGPSDELKKINQSVQDFGNKVVDEAGTIFGAANSVFNDIKNATSNIIKGGAYQMGMGAAEHNARTALAVQLGGTEARNLKGAAASAVGAIGGGNIVTPAGSTQAMTFAADQKAAADTAMLQNQIETESAEMGRDNFWKAISEEKQAPGVFNVVSDANKTAMDAQKQQLTSQQNIDTQNNWWQPLLEKGVMAGVSAATGGIGGAAAKFATGGFGKSASSGGDYLTKNDISGS